MTLHWRSLLAVVVLGLVAALLLVTAVSEDDEDDPDVEVDLDAVEGLKMPKFPSVKSITAPLLGPIKAIPKDAANMGKKIGKDTAKMGKKISKDIANMGKKIGKDSAKMGKKIAGSFANIFAQIKLGVLFLKNIPSCMLWYLIEILGWMLYAPIAFVFWLFSLRSVERMIWQYVDATDGLVHRAVGFHPFHFSIEVRNKCYFANTKDSEVLKSFGGGHDDVDVSIGDIDVDDTALLGYLVCCVLGGAIAWSLAASSSSSSSRTT